ncbi:MAG TPA: ATP-binding protein [Acidimicrobiia bacterium]|nr:ATP-binding protein [Acidimicrobiia bacterium]
MMRDRLRFSRSIRFRLSALYSGVVFGLGGLVLGLVYVAVRWQLTRQTETRMILRGQQLQMGQFQLIIDPRLEEAQVRTLESLFNQFVLDQLARYTLVALGLLFLISLVVGWVIAGRALAPVNRITQVAREIEASDLSRRIALPGPDDELTRLAGTFDAMLDRLEGAFASQRRFLADTSHDLRTPLSVIRSNVEVTLDDPEASSDEWRRTGEIVARNAAAMGSMIEGLLAAARFETGQAAMVGVDLAALVTQAADDHEAAAAAAGVKIDLVTRPVQVQGDPLSLRRAVGNLIDNALRVAPAGSLLTIGAGRVDGWGFLGVADQGPGFRTPSEEPGLRGPGLGLSIVEQVAQLHGGRFAVFSRELEPTGTTMIVWMPINGGENPPSINPL